MVIIWLMMVHNLVGGFSPWFSPTPLKNDGLKVSWDDDYSQYDGKNKIYVPNHQPIRNDGGWLIRGGNSQQYSYYMIMDDKDGKHSQQ